MRRFVWFALLAGCTLDIDALRGGDAGSIDGGHTIDGGMDDGGMDDGGMDDGGMIDGGMIDGGMNDAGMDAGMDGGMDVGRCPTACAPIGARCSTSTVVATCAIDAMGCAVETTMPCGPGLVCDPTTTACVPPCTLVEECPRASYCDADDRVTCANDLNSCLVESMRDACPFSCREGMPAACSPNPCPAAMGALTCGMAPIMDNTSNAPAVLNQSICTGAPYLGREVIYRFEPTAIANVTIATTSPTPTANDYNLFVIDATGDVLCTAGACTGSSLNPNGDESVTFVARPGATYYVIYDGRSAGTGIPYTMTISCTGGTCGDGTTTSPEACDDGNTTSGDGCSSTCIAEGGFECAGSPSSCIRLCGNRTTDPSASESCDDGNTTSGDGCSSACVREPGWSCSGAPSTCVRRCGNNTIDASAQETCDDGNTNVGDGCSSGCQIEPGWTCSGTPSMCVHPCGNHVVDAGERCDDGNLVAGDGCAPSCLLEPGFRCDAMGCRRACGDGLVEADYAETCDDANIVNGDGCSSTCVVEPQYICTGTMPSTCMRSCPNGVVDAIASETCDDGNMASSDGCSSSCQTEPGFVCYGNPSVCGPPCPNGRLETGEECDDNNPASGDGCTMCRIDPGFVCSGMPSSCVLACGNGQVDGGDLCDDGNTTMGDGCTMCTFDPGFYCTGEPSTCVPVVCGNALIEGGESCNPPGMGCSTRCALPTSPSGMTRMLSGTLDAMDPTYVRLNQPCGASSSRNVFYETFVLENTTAAAQTLDLTANWANDGYLHVYRWPFVAAAPEVRCVNGNDDFMGTSQSQLLDVPIAPGERLVVVASTYAAMTAIGAYSISVRTD